jgi:hypothetical protein
LMQHLVSSLSVSGRPVQVERELVLSQPEIDDTKCRISTIQPPDDEHIMLETYRGLK